MARQHTSNQIISHHKIRKWVNPPLSVSIATRLYIIFHRCSTYIHVYTFSATKIPLHTPTYIYTMDSRALLAPKSRDEATYASLQRYNTIAAILHGVSFVLAFIMVCIYRDKTFDAELTWDPRLYSPNASQSRIETAGPYESETVHIGYTRLAWVIIWFPLITAAFHTYIARNAYTFYSSVLNIKSNKLRWLEYSITASFMTCVIAQIAGITNIFLIIEIGVIDTILLQYLGHLIEERVSDAVSMSQPVIDICANVLACAWALFGWQWTSILVYFYHAVESRKPPLFVYLVVLVLLVFYMSFGAIQLWYIYTVSQNAAAARSHYITMEKRFIVASFTSKLALEWILIYGLVTNGMASTD